MIRIALAGAGHWGTNYLRVFHGMDSVEIVSICDSRQEVMERVKKQYPSLKGVTNFSQLLEDSRIDAIVIATPACTHAPFVKEALQAGKHVLVEKPMALDLPAAIELVKLSEENKRILMVGHTFLYNNAVRKMKELIREGRLGKIYYLQGSRTHLGLIRDDVSAIWDLAPHDVSIFSYLLDREPHKVSAVASSCLKPGLEDVAFINLFYPEGIIGNIHLSWVDSNKLRQIAVVGSKARVLFDDLNSLERLRIFEKGISLDKPYDSFGEFQLLLRDGDIISPKIEAEEPLRIVCREFIHCVETGKKPLADAFNGLRVIRTLCAMQESIKRDGEPVLVEAETPVSLREKR